MPHDVMTIGSATMDIFMKSKHFHLQPSADGVLLCQEYGGKIDVDAFEMQSGGAGTNTAVGFRRLGFHTATVVEIGKDFFAQVVWDELKRERVDTEFVVTEKAEQTGVSLLLIAEEGGRSVLTHRGAASLLEARDIPWQALRDTRWIHLSNINGNKEVLLRIFDHLRHSHVGMSWNPGHRELELLACGEMKIDQISCDMFFVNKEEWAIIQPIQHIILKEIPFVIITDGKHGGEVFFHATYHSRYTIQEVPVTQETGAGDAFIVGFVGAHLCGKEIVDCIAWGVKNSANVVQYMGAKTGLLYRKDFPV